MKNSISQDLTYGVRMLLKHPGVTAIAAPIFNRAGDVLGSLSLAARNRKVDAKFTRLTGPVVKAALQVTEEIARSQQISDFPARAIG